MKKLYSTLVALFAATTFASGCITQEEMVDQIVDEARGQIEEKLEISPELEKEANKGKSISHVLEFLEKGDEALEKRNVEGESRREALEKEGYNVDSGVYMARLNTPKLPPTMWVTCNYGDSQHIKIRTDEDGMSVTKSKNIGGWSGMNVYYNQFLNYGDESILNWRSSWNVLSFDMGEDTQQEESGKGFGDFCEHAMAGNYRRMFNSPAFYCVSSGEGDSDYNTGKTAQALLFLQDVEDIVCK